MGKGLEQTFHYRVYVVSKYVHKDEQHHQLENYQGNRDNFDVDNI